MRPPARPMVLPVTRHPSGCVMTATGKRVGIVFIPCDSEPERPGVGSGIRLVEGRQLVLWDITLAYI